MSTLRLIACAALLITMLAPGMATAKDVLQSALPKPTMLQNLGLLNTPYIISLQKIHLNPDESRPRHIHTAPKVAYVLEGDVTFVVDGQPPKTFRAGESYQLQAFTSHTMKSGPAGATVLVTWLAEKNKPLSVLVP